MCLEQLKIIFCLPGTQILLGILYFYLLNVATWYWFFFLALIFFGITLRNTSENSCSWSVACSLCVNHLLLRSMSGFHLAIIKQKYSGVVIWKIRIYIIFKCFLCARFVVMCFNIINIFITTTTPKSLGWSLLLKLPFYGWETWGSEILSDISNLFLNPSRLNCSPNLLCTMLCCV